MNKKHEVGRRLRTPDDQAKLAALRDTINRSIERGGNYTDEEVAAYIERLHARAGAASPLIVCRWSPEQIRWTLRPN